MNTGEECAMMAEAGEDRDGRLAVVMRDIVAVRSERAMRRAGC